MRFVTLMFLALILCSSCGKDNDDEQKEGNCMTAVINSEDFTAESTTGTFVITSIDYENLGVQETKLLTINGTIPSLTDDIKTITLSFACSEFTSTLDYVDSDSDCGIGMNYQVTSLTNPSGTIAIAAMEGTINIEENSDDHIRGTFTFKGEDQNGVEYNITDGFFDTTIN